MVAEAFLSFVMKNVEVSGALPNRGARLGDQ
jgi:hypothetical protein